MGCRSGEVPPGQTSELHLLKRLDADSQGDDRSHDADQETDPASLLNFYRRLLRVRRQTPALLAGAYVPLHEAAGDYLAFLRQLAAPKASCLVALNMADKAQDLTFDLAAGQVQCLFSSHERPAGPQDLRDLRLAPFEVFIGALS